MILLAAVMYWYDTFFVNVVFAALGGLAVFEGLRALGFGKRPVVIALFIALHTLNMAVLPPAHYVVCLALFMMFCLVMYDKRHRNTFKEGAGALAIFIMVSMGLASLLHLRAMTTLRGDRLFMMFIALALGWICDTFAYTFGRLFGKRKMCPTISPNKTIAGGVGGVVGTMVFIAGAFYIYSLFANPRSMFFERNGLWHMVFYAVMGALGAMVGITGDLAASFVKRECAIKDFGSIMPGHGGALDRLDSVLFTAAFAMFAFELYTILFPVVMLFAN